jgi:hypothetical protein
MLTNTTHATQYIENSATPDLPEVKNQAYRRLALEVVYQAVNDVKASHIRSVREDALTFLREEGPEWLSMAGYGIQRGHWETLLTKLDEIHAQRCREEQLTKFAKSLVRILRITFNQTTYAAQPIGG